MIVFSYKLWLISESGKISTECAGVKKIAAAWD
jgi:hypothetical protein